MADLRAFIRKWNGRTLDDAGCYVSKEYHSFQVAFMNAMRKIAKSLGGELVNPSYGHYDMSGFIRRGDRYVYFSYDNGIGYGGRTYVALRENNSRQGYHCPMLLRTAAHERDYTGGGNHFEAFEACEAVIDKLLDTEHKKWV